MATTRRYQSDQRAGTPQGRDPFSYGQGIRAPAAPNIPMPPRPSAAPPGPPRIYEPRITPAQARFEGQSKIASQLSQVLGDWGDRFYKKAEAHAQKTGYETGLEYGHQTGSMELREGTTVYDMAFNKGARATYESRIAIDAHKRISELEIESKGRVSTFDQTSNSYRDATLKAIEDPQTRAYATNKIDQSIVNSRTRLLKQEFADARTVDVLQFNETLTDNRGQIQLAIDRKDYAQAFNLVFEGEEKIAEGVASMFIDENDAVQLREKLRDWVIKQYWVEKYEEELANARPILDKNGNPTGQTSADLYYADFANNLPDTESNLIKEEGGTQLIEDPSFEHWQMSPELHKNISNAMWTKRSQQSSLAAGERAKARAEAAAQKVILTEQVNDAVTALKEGKVPDGLAELQELVSGDFKLSNQLEEEKKYFEAGVEFRAMTLPAQSQYLAEQQQRQEMSGDEAELLKRLEAAHNETQTDIAGGNGLLRAAKDGVISKTDLTVPNIQTPDDFAALLRKRDGMALLAQSHYGVPIDRFSPAEVSSMVQQYAETDIQGKLQLFGVIVDNLQAEPAQDLLAEFDKKGAKNLAMAGSVYLDGAPEVAARILKGQSTPAEILPQKKEINQEIFDEIGNVYIADQTGAATVHVMNAIRALYAYDSFLAGDVTAVLDTDRLDNAINAVTGGIAEIEWNGSGVMYDDKYSVPVPVRGWDSDDMETWLESITADDLKRLGGTHPSFPEADVAKLLNNSELRLSFARGFGSKRGAGYLLNTYNGHFVLDANGRPFMLEHNPGLE